MSFKNTPPSAVSTKLTFPCTECNFEAQSARQLSRHKAVTHTQNALKCVLCPFVTAYQTNLLRHRKDVHGICGSKGNKSCKFCGFVSEDNDTLIQHQIEFHQDILKTAQAKFAKELVSAGGEENVADFSANFESMSEDFLNNKNNSSNTTNIVQTGNKKRTAKNLDKHQQNNFKSSTNSTKSMIANNNNNNNDDDDVDANDEQTEFEEFWKAGFIDQQYDDHSNYYGSHTVPLITMNTAEIAQNESVPASSRSSTPKSQSSSNVMNVNNISNNNSLHHHMNNNNNSSIADLPATRIRRQYNCNDCGFRTVNPREFLYHRRDGHGYKVKIVECPYCVYACQYVQKLQRHLLLVHKLTSVMDSPSEQGGANGELEQLLVKRKYRRTSRPIESNSIEQNVNHLETINDDAASPPNDDYEQNDRAPDFEPMNNFEMNLNEYHEMIEDAEMESNTSNNDSDDKKFMFNLECYICKIKFGDAISAQKHFLKHHKHSNSNYKGMTSIMKNHEQNTEESANWKGQPTTTNQKKIFDSNAKNVHVCNFCGYKTRWISELERHIRVHSKEKPFKCLYCNFRSKWKGDLNRHIQRYHSNETNLQDMESSDNSTNGGGIPITSNIMLPNDNQDDAMNEDSYLTTGDYEMYEMDEDNTGLSQDDQVNTNDQDNELSDVDNSEIVNGNSAKMYKCTYCDFMCSTASRFHVHYVQHLNTKPFQCSICGHRSNWEWDVTKHIKMKAQRDPIHEKAHPVLIHDSGKRDYSKYNKFVVWIGRDEADIANEVNNRIDFRARRFKSEGNEYENEDNGFGEAGGNLLVPEVNFEIDDESSVEVFSNTTRKYSKKSSIVSRHPNSSSKLISCSQCDFRHHFARVMVAHMSSHNQTKPYGCNECSFETKWREMIFDHYSSIHENLNPNDFEIRFRCAIDENSVCRILSADEVSRFEKNNMSNISPPSQSTSTTTSMTLQNDHHNSSLIEPNIYEEKTVIRCELCPFITTNMKKMSIHCRFHNPSKGSLKCKQCPYYINNPDKLKRHQKLHQKTESIPLTAPSPLSTLHHSTNMINENSNDVDYQQQSKLKYSSLISCSLCTFQTSNVQSLNDHMNNTHNHIHSSQTNLVADDNIGDNGDYGLSENILEQTLVENVFKNGSSPTNNNENQSSNNTKNYDDDDDDDKHNFIAVDSIKNNGEAKIFSYVCPDCPAAFKSPGDYNVHAHFHSSNYQHACPYCTYKARNKPQLCKHLYVHTAEYIAKRASSYPEGTKLKVENQMNANKPISNNQTSSKNNSTNIMNMPLVKKISIKKAVRRHRTKMPFPMKPVKARLNSEQNGKQNIIFKNNDLMASQEFLETKEYLQRINSGIKNRCMYRCSKCPAVFTKVNTLIYHTSLHEENYRFSCESCNYSTETEDNLSIHSLLHNLTESQSALGYNFNYNCHKCPAGFSKRSRLEKHLSLHGAQFNWKCDKCDYSVRYAATLVKHRAIHLINPNFQAMEYGQFDNIINDDEDRDQEQHSYTVHQISNDVDDCENYAKPDLKLKLNLTKLRDNLHVAGTSFQKVQQDDDDGGDDNSVANMSSIGQDDDDEDLPYGDDDVMNPSLLLEEGEME
ncbi:uncharacterized protein LOC113792774 isoform X1 [Dermatophagoides pteronyssinus]|uniref:uncharacterized protein LOC113792774 isoform X1 n=2 Tax=Dermatophagoides pteronyssinus TaxID=6956 RepID=UPI003F67112B